MKNKLLVTIGKREEGMGGGMWIADQQVQTLGIKYAVRFIVQLGECS